MCAFDRYQNRRPWMTLNSCTGLCRSNYASLGAQHTLNCVVLQVVVSDVIDSEGCVLVHLQASDRLVQLEQLLDRLDDVYSATDDDNEADVTLVSCHPGDAVAVCVATIWQRATVLSRYVTDSEGYSIVCMMMNE